MFLRSRADHLRRGRSFSPLIIAHRGASGSAPENTLFAFSKAIDQGADAIELDVRLSKDREVVVIHDSTLRRTTNGTGRVSDRSLRDLKTLDAGSWFHPRFAGERIPTLGEVLQLARHSGLAGKRVWVNIEIKPVRNKSLADCTVEQCLRVVQQHRAQQVVVLTSFQHSLLRIARTLNDGMALGIIFHPLQHWGKSPVALARRYDARVIVCGLRYLRHRWVERAMNDGMTVASYTVNTDGQFERAERYSVGGVITNYPGRMTSKRGVIAKA